MPFMKSERVYIWVTLKFIIADKFDGVQISSPDSDYNSDDDSTENEVMYKEIGQFYLEYCVFWDYQILRLMKSNCLCRHLSLISLSFNTLMIK